MFVDGMRVGSASSCRPDPLQIQLCPWASAQARLRTGISARDPSDPRASHSLLAKADAALSIQLSTASAKAGVAVHARLHLCDCTEGKSHRFVPLSSTLRHLRAVVADLLEARRRSHVVSRCLSLSTARGRRNPRPPIVLEENSLLCCRAFVFVPNSWGEDARPLGASILVAVHGEEGQLRSLFGAPGEVADAFFASSTSLVAADSRRRRRSRRQCSSVIDIAEEEGPPSSSRSLGFASSNPTFLVISLISDERVTVRAPPALSVRLVSSVWVAGGALFRRLRGRRSTQQTSVSSLS